MAIIKCSECGHEVSTKAVACPNCGAPPASEQAFAPVQNVNVAQNQQTMQAEPKGMGCRSTIAVIVLIFILGYIIVTIMSGPSPNTPPKTTTATQQPTTPKVELTEEQKAARAKAAEEKKIASQKAAEERKLAQEKAAKEHAAAEKAKYVNELKELLTAGTIKNMQNIGKITEEIQIAANLALLDNLAQTAADGGKYAFTPEETAIWEQYKTQLRQTQNVIFPKLRDAYGPIARKLMWEYDISARTIGNRFTTLEFTGAAFAANKNKKEFMENIWDVCKKMRFKRVNYKWHKYDDTYTYYTIDSPTDNEIILWSNGVNTVMVIK